jgi:diketogulonate reductase-like aldo/keto reductase
MKGMDRRLTVQGVSVPSFFYGTAWKEERTAELTGLALMSGFAAIDTANQRKHYFEEAVGDAVAAFLAEGHHREELFLQTKFTSGRGQDHRLPYDPRASTADQVEQSLASSLQHLRVSYVDSLVLHGPERAYGLTEGDREAWSAMESRQRAGQARLLGVSNVSLAQLEALYREATVKPALVQNRCFARDGWNAEVRAFCRDHGLAYQGFSLLTANGRALASPLVEGIALRAGRTPAQVVFRFALQASMIPITGTTSAAHMREDLACFDFELADEDVQAIARVSA